MQRRLQNMLRHVAQYRAGYWIAMFLLIAAVTCGVRTGAAADQEQLEFLLNFRRIIGLVLWEAACAALMLLSMTHPFGCALCAGIVAYKGFSTGYLWSWWLMKYGWSGAVSYILLIIPQGILSLAGCLWGCCTAGYAALRICRLFPREALRCVMDVWLMQMIALAMRCIGCAWIG